MIKNLLNHIFTKITEQSRTDITSFKFKDTTPKKSDFEVSELSYDEYVQLTSTRYRKPESTFINY